MAITATGSARCTAKAQAVMKGPVAGIVTLTQTHLAFKPNRMNRALHDGNIQRRVVLAQIEDIQAKFGLSTLIVEITSDDVMARFRCWGAKKFAGKIDEYIREAKSAS